ncbi:MAG: hypothetical protein OXO48_01770 [Caldilineaceae bacterium]|nr:hypothetical protein [Caldilineaceae bacterium]
MDGNKSSRQGPTEGTIYPEYQWKEKLSNLKKSGARKAKELRGQGHPFIVRILTTAVVKGGDTIPLRGVVMNLDWKIATRLEMVESANAMITNAYIIDSLDPALPHVLGSIIEGKGLYEHSVGQFFELYGRFEGKYQLKRSRDTRDKMTALVNGDKRYLVRYKEYGKSVSVPMPWAVRNILSHAGSNPNKLNPKRDEIRTSIDLLRSWVD